MSILAPNQLNSIDMIKPLLLTDSRGKATVFKSKIGLHRLVVPSDLGGRLTVEIGMQTPDPDIRIVVNDSSGNSHFPPDRDLPVHIDLAPGARGGHTFMVFVRAPSGRYALKATFTDFGVARDRDGSALIPWNFWFFPYAQDQKERSAWGGTALQPLQKYEKAFDNPGALAWEREKHADPHGTAGPADGHCHNAAAASVLFEPPPDEGLTHNGVHFKAEELKFLATEFFGSYRALRFVWELHGTEPQMNGPLHWLKPSDDPKFFATYRELNTKVPAGFLALLTTLREEIRDQGHALIMDLGDASGAVHSEVWNHAVYQYAEEYWQTKSEDPLLVEGRTILLAHADLYLDGESTGLPATPTTRRGRVSAKPNSRGELRFLEYRLRFNEYGHPDPKSEDHRWYQSPPPVVVVCSRHDRRSSSRSHPRSSG